MDLLQRDTAQNEPHFRFLLNERTSPIPIKRLEMPGQFGTAFLPPIADLVADLSNDLPKMFAK